METEERPVLFKMGRREQAVTIDDAQNVHGYLIGRELHIEAFRRTLGASWKLAVAR